jgi:hypothetical protein
MRPTGLTRPLGSTHYLPRVPNPSHRRRSWALRRVVFNPSNNTFRTASAAIMSRSQALPGTFLRTVTKSGGQAKI